MKRILLFAVLCTSICNVYSQQHMVETLERKTFIDFVGSGDIQKALSEGKETNANTGVGIVIEQFFGIRRPVKSFSVETLINVATTADSAIANFDANGNLANRRIFGTYMLNPISSKQAMYINANINVGQIEHSQFAKTFSKVVNGFNIKAIASNNVWKYKDTTCNLGAFSCRIGIYHEFLPDSIRITDEGKSKYSFLIGTSFTYRALFGDVTTDKNNQFRQEVLGNQQKRFYGWEWFLGFRLNNLIAEFNAPVIDTKGVPIEGLNYTQFNFSIRFIGGFGLKLNT